MSSTEQQHAPGWYVVARVRDYERTNISDDKDIAYYDGGRRGWQGTQAWACGLYPFAAVLAGPFSPAEVLAMQRVCEAARRVLADDPADRARWLHLTDALAALDALDAAREAEEEETKHGD